MATKVSRFIKEIARMLKDDVDGAVLGNWFLCLLNASHAFDYADEWSDVSSLECSFKGYARRQISLVPMGNPTEPTSGKWQVRTPPQNFAYDSGDSGGLSTEVAYMWAVIVDTGSEFLLMELKDLAVPKTFAADGDELTLEWFYNALNCDE